MIEHTDESLSDQNIIDMEKAKERRKPKIETRWLCNYEVHTVRKGKQEKEIKFGKSCIEMLETLGNLWKEPLRRVGAQVFGIHDDQATFFKNTSEFFAWMATQDIRIDWAKSGDGLVEKGELFKYLSFSVKKFDFVSNSPHWPPLKGVHYLKPPQGMATGALDQLISMFQPSTEFDRQMLKAALITPFWGGRGGSRPLFVLDGEEKDPEGGRGIGKSKFVEVVAYLSGGFIDLDLTMKADDVKKRLLGATTEMIVRYDNVKALKASSEVLENLVTSPVINGHMMHFGNASRPNYFTYFMTFNGANLSKDLAKRMVHIRLKRMEDSSNWDENMLSFLEDNKGNILADVAAFFDSPVPAHRTHTRFGAWEKAVAQRILGRPLDPATEILDRQIGADDDQHLTEDLVDCFESNISRFYRRPFGGGIACVDPNGIPILIERNMAVEWVRKCLHLNGVSKRYLLNKIRLANVPQISALDWKRGPHRFIVWNKPPDYSGKGWRLVSEQNLCINEHDEYQFEG